MRAIYYRRLSPYDGARQESLSRHFTFEKALQAEYVYLGIEDNKPLAIEEMKKHSEDLIGVVPLKTKYPQGGETDYIRLDELQVPRCRFLWMWAVWWTM